ncbi:hypothetical protein COL81_17420 [Bacillus toyonensis]|nr:hypothetical protein [Bacillus toyonensis]PGA38125.1 hypothetical protein COL81_17420 [Bacillus toyonensis]PGC09640.1 hypothetical protein COM20_01575 [Bacillus toyonensis]
MVKRENKSNHPLYSTWDNMMRRCHVEHHPNYKYYGGKGVTVDERWHDFDKFVYDIDNHMLNGHLLYQKGYHLDKDIKGGKIYSLENCMIITAEENKRLGVANTKRRILAIKGTEQIEFESVTFASKNLKLSRRTIQLILQSGRKTNSGYTFRYVG